MTSQVSSDSFPDGKKAYVAGMFDDIAFKYDFLNHFLSFGIDIRWRKQLVRQFKISPPKKVLDLATGTGDLAINIARSYPESSVTGIDISEQMLRIGALKVDKNNLTDRIELKMGDAENIDYPDEAYDAVIVAFGVRNYENLNRGLTEMLRVLKTGGKLAILEFSMPSNKSVLILYKFYFRVVLPFIGRMISKNFYAYTYLPDSVNDFPDPPSFIKILQQIGYKDVKCKKLTFGICSLFTGLK
jgi:demethylmenaquinone methyltransferase / 2-methoxy-6-polyprenyl-1,4-benzoquinol methylase